MAIDEVSIIASAGDDYLAERTLRSGSAGRVLAAFMRYFALYGRHRLVANSPDEEFAVLARAEEELE